MCGKEYEVTKKSTQRFCNIDCQNEWQKTRVGKLNPKYVNCFAKCDYCGKSFHTHQYDLDTKNFHFCCKKCRQAWYAKVLTQSDDWKEKSRINAVKELENRAVGKTDTKPQEIINNSLKDMGLQFQNEYNCKFYSMDNAILFNNNLYFIEVMGTYWHCDRRKYKKISYKMQYNRIIKDKAKHTYIVNNFGVEILYLWEYDIYNNLELCRKLILDYIHNKLTDYVSSDYALCNHKVKINKDKIIQYMFLNNFYDYLDISLKPKLSRKQLDKWITFKCEVCGKEHEELLSHYKKSKNHFCSYECANKFHENGVELECIQCHKKFVLSISDYNRHKNKNEMFCSSECRKQYHNITFNCEYCGKQATVEKCQYKKTKHHYCSKQCAYADGLGKGKHHLPKNII